MSSSATFTGQFPAFLHGMFEITARTDKSQFLKIFQSEVVLNTSILPATLYSDDISYDPLAIHFNCPIGNVQEPSVNSVAICFGSLGDYGPSRHLKVGLNMVAE